MAALEFVDLLFETPCGFAVFAADGGLLNNCDASTCFSICLSWIDHFSQHYLDFVFSEHMDKFRQRSHTTFC
jgi:hypothetical protein